MTAMFVLMGLLLFSYLGTLFAAGRRRFGSGLPSSSEYLLIGVIVGPIGVGIASHDTLTSFDPIAYVAIGWLSFAAGLGYGHVGVRRVPLRRVALGVLLTLACGASVAATVWCLSPRIATLPFDDRLLLAVAMGSVCAESTRHAILWTVRRHGAEGPLTDLLRDLSHSDEIVPIAGAAWLLAWRAPSHAIARLPSLSWTGVTVAMGLFLGLLTTTLLARDRRAAESWGTLLGVALMAIGLASRLDLSSVAVMFILGVSVARFSRHGNDVEAMVSTTERAVTLPALLLAGARLEPTTIGRLGLLIPIAVTVRVLVKWGAGNFLRLHAAARGGGPLLGFGLASSGGMSILVGLAIALRFPGAIGDTVLATAVGATLVGEPTGPLFHRHLLSRVGEVPAPSVDGSARSDQSDQDEQDERDALHHGGSEAAP